MPIDRSNTVFIDDKILIPIDLAGKEYFIGCDRHNFIFGQRSAKTKLKSGQDSVNFSNDVSYYSDLKSLMVGLQKRKLKNLPAKTLDELQNNIKQSKEEVLGLYAQLTKEELI